MTKLAVVLPVGPRGHHADFLPQALQSLTIQTRPPDELVFVDDMHGLDEDLLAQHAGGLAFHVYRPPWRLGVAHAFNHGIAVAHQRGADLALMMGADDTLERRVLELLQQVYENRKAAGVPDAYYGLDVQYSSTGEVQDLFCNAAAVTPGLWRRTGGMPIEGAAGQMDAAYISQLMVHLPGALQHVQGPEGRYIWRQHDNMATGDVTAQLSDALITVRNYVTETFRIPDWGRYE